MIKLKAATKIEFLFNMLVFGFLAPRINCLVGQGAKVSTATVAVVSKAANFADVNDPLGGKKTRNIVKSGFK